MHDQAQPCTTVISSRIIKDADLVPGIDVLAMNAAENAEPEFVPFDELCEWEAPVEFSDPEALACAKEMLQGGPLALLQDQTTA